MAPGASRRRQSLRNFPNGALLIVSLRGAHQAKPAPPPRRADAAGAQIEWVEGDAERLPFADASFVRVLSVFGAMFAPDQRRTAEELVRTCRPGGTIGLCSRTPQGVFGQMIFLLISRGPPPPPGFRPPGLWGVEDFATGLFEGFGVELEFAREQIVFEHDSAEARVAHLDRVFGPTIVSRALAVGRRGCSV